MSVLFFSAAVLSLMFALGGSALAYIDPASTSYVIQIIAAVFAAGGAALAIYWKKIQIYFRKRKQRKLDEQRAAELRAGAAGAEAAAQTAADAAKDAAAAAESFASTAEKLADAAKGEDASAN